MKEPRPAADPRLEQILDVLLAIARQDFSVRARVGPRLDTIDAIATGINALAEELDGAVSSKQELQAAYDALRQTQAQLVQAGKLAAIGQLSSGVAHEINNPATWAILSLAVLEREVEGLRRELGAERQDRGRIEAHLGTIELALEDAREGIQRISLVAGDLRTFARTDHEVREPIDVDEVVRVSCRVAAPAYRLRARLISELGQVPPVMGSRGRLGQVVTNLLVNAAQALAEPDPERHVICVSTKLVGSDVVIAVEDSGAGIPEELRERVFEPFFTTKPEHVGTGLGLALARDIVRDHGGQMRVTSSRYGGARVEVHLPALLGLTEAAAAKRASELRVEPDPDLESKPRVLVVDDELLLLRALGNYLKSSADVTLAEGGARALSLLAEDPAFDLVLCDLNMPGVDGPTVYDRALESHPELVERFVFLTGGALTQRARDFLDRVKPRVVHKPVSADALLALVHETWQKSELSD